MLEVVLMDQYTNQIMLRGTLLSLPQFSHENHGKKFFRFTLEVPRISGTVDLLPIVASVFNMLAVFQKDEQKTRYLVLCNASIFCAYYIIIGSTSLLAELLAVITTVIALVKYRNKA